jgi:hypothetical protein
LRADATTPSPSQALQDRITKIVAVNYVSGQSIELQVCLIRNENIYHANNRARSYVINQSWKERFIFQILVMLERKVYLSNPCNVPERKGMANKTVYDQH